MGFVKTPAVKDMPLLMLERYLDCCDRYPSEAIVAFTKSVFVSPLIFIEKCVSSLSLMSFILAAEKY
jgi:hypothetical protein